MHIIANLARSTRSTNITKEICQKSKIMYIPISMELDRISHKKDRCGSELHRRET